MGKIILLCGKLCSGKSRYAAQLLSKGNTVLLSCDEMMYDLELDNLLAHLGDAHMVMTPKIKRHLYKKAVEIVGTGADVVLDFGFWGMDERRALTELLRANDVRFEWHYLNVSDTDWELNLADRRRACEAGAAAVYMPDDGLLKKMRRQFEEPTRDEIDVWVDNRRA